MPGLRTPGVICSCSSRIRGGNHGQGTRALADNGKHESRDWFESGGRKGGRGREFQSTLVNVYDLSTELWVRHVQLLLIESTSICKIAEFRDMAFWPRRKIKNGVKEVARKRTLRMLTASYVGSATAFNSRVP